MKTFPHWRAVGRVMRWARQQDGVTVKPPTRGAGIRIRVYRDPMGAIVQTCTSPGSTWLKTYTGRVGSADVTPNTAAEGLRVLAALDLIPADIAYGPDERYGRCLRCGRRARWWDDPLAARWVHDLRLAWTGDPHQAEVADA